MKQLIVVTEGGKKSGFGHITRCISIATHFLHHEYSVHYIINGDDSLLNIMQPYSYEIYNWLNKKQRLLDKIREGHLILLDSIKISNEHIKQLESLNIPLIYIDDEKQRNVLESGFVIDWTIFRDMDNSFSTKKENVNYFLGSLYTPLRKEFFNATINPIRKNVEKIMLTLGGSDVRNLTPFILETLNTHYPNLQKDIIIGDGFNNSEEIKKHTSHNTNLIYNATANDMIRSMQTSDIAIAAGGQTLYELAKIAIPTIGILLVQNGKDDTLGWAKTGFLRYVGKFNNPSLKTDIVNEIENLSPYEIRKKMQDNGLKYISQNGAERLVDEIIKVLHDTVRR